MASEDKKKVVGLDTVWVFKDYIDKVREEIANNTDLSMKEYFNIKFKEEADKIKNNYDSQLIELNKRLDYVEQFGTPEEVEQIRLQLNALTTNTNDKFANLDKLNKDLEILSGEYEDIKNSVFTEGQINELINAAMIEGVTITGDGIATENIYATKLVAFMADFGKISAANIEAGDITGHTIASGEVIPGTDIPRWKIGDSGEGWLANENIKWNENGDVTFGENVKIKWDNVDEKPDIPEEGLTESDVNNIISTTITKDYVESLEVRATDIIGDTITGKTIQSSNNSWMIGKDGDGHLANENIKWDEQGNLSISSNVNINGKAIANGIENATDEDKLRIGEIVADYVDAGTVVTDVLETKPDKTTDKIHIEDNYIHCINSTGDKNLIISSNALDLSKINKILSTGYESDTRQLILNDITLTNTDTETYPYANSDVWYSHTSPIELGYILKGSSVDIYISLIALNVTSENYNSLTSSQKINANNWMIQQGSGPVPFIVDGGGTTYSGGCILIYKKNDSGDWEEYDNIWLKGSWYNTSAPWSSTTSTAPIYKTQGSNYNTVNINEDGEYGILLGFEAGSIRYSSAALRSISGLIKAFVDQAIPSAYTEIGKNGIVTYDGINSFRLTSEGVEIRSNSSSTKFYGIKITSGGMYYCNGGSAWVSWDPANIELTNTVNDLQTRMTTAEQEIDNIQDALSN